MSLIRSKQLGAGQSVHSTYFTMYTCPAGKVALVKSVRVLCISGGAAEVLIRVLLASGTPVIRYFAAALADNTPVLDDSWWVLEAGDALQLYCDHDTGYYYVSGAELSL